MPDDSVPKVVVGVALIDDCQRVLLVSSPKWPGQWAIPGGKVQYGETVLDALKREIHEETGLTVQDAQFVRYGELIGNANFCAGRHMVFLDFLSRSFSGDIRLEKRELDGYEWIPIAEALGKQLTPPTRELLGYLTRPANT